MIKFFKKLLNYLEEKGLIKKKSPKGDQTITPKEETITKTEIQEESTLTYGSSQNEEQISDLTFGDIILAKRYKSEEEKESIPYGHREGPFIVVGNTKEGVMCLYGTGTEPKNKSFMYRTLFLHEEDYCDALTKDTYIHIAINEEISSDRILQYLGRLHQNDIKELHKKIGITKDEGLYVEEISYDEIPLEPGDIFEKDNVKLLILLNENKRYICLPLKPKNVPRSILIDGIRYEIDFRNIEILNDISPYKRNNTISTKLLRAILHRYHNYLNFEENYGTITRGSIVTYEGNYYYINGEIGDAYSAYQIAVGYDKEDAVFKVGDEPFHSDFVTQVTFLKKDHPYTYYTTATEDEMTQIKEAKKNYQKKHKTKTKSSKYKKQDKYAPNITSGTLVTEQFTGKKYIVITRNDRRLIVMSEENYKNFNYYLEKLSVTSVSFHSRMHPIAFKALLEELLTKAYIIKGHISKENLKKLINEHI